MHEPDGDARLRHETRARVRRWAFGFALAVLVLGVLPASAGGQWPTALAMAVIAGLPLAAHIWWAGAHPIDIASSPPAVLGQDHPPHSPLGRLSRIADAAGQLEDRGWIAPADHRAIRDRVRRLTDLVEVDAARAQLGGTASPVVREEIDRLQETVLGLLDEAIRAAAVEPGDADVDARLRAQRDLLRGRRAALDEVEGRGEGTTGTA